MNISITVIPYVNFMILIFVVLSMYIGYKRGFLYQVFSLLAILTSIFVSWFFAPVASQMFSIFPKSWTPFAYTEFADVFYHKLNTLSWYVILFFAIAIIFLMLKPAAKSVQNLPIIGFVNRVLGMIFGLIPSLVLLVFITYFLSTPLVKNGKDIIEQTWLLPIRNVTTNVIALMDEPYQLNEAIQKLTSDPISLDQEDLQILVEWLTDEHQDTQEIYDFINEHSVEQIEHPENE